MEKKIVGFHVDDLGDWVADLECGHGQHVRHNPPWINRPWVLDEAGRESMLGQVLSCKKCNMPAIPGNAKRVTCSPLFDQQMLQQQCSGPQENASDCWIELVVSQGELVYQRHTDHVEGYVIDPEFSAVIPPGTGYTLIPKGDVQMCFHYYEEQ